MPVGGEGRRPSVAAAGVPAAAADAAAAAVGEQPAAASQKGKGSPLHVVRVDLKKADISSLEEIRSAASRAGQPQSSSSSSLQILEVAPSAYVVAADLSARPAAATQSASPPPRRGSPAPAPQSGAPPAGGAGGVTPAAPSLGASLTLGSQRIFSEGEASPGHVLVTGGWGAGNPAAGLGASTTPPAAATPRATAAPPGQGQGHHHACLGVVRSALSESLDPSGAESLGKAFAALSCLPPFAARFRVLPPAPGAAPGQNRAHVDIPITLQGTVNPSIVSHLGFPADAAGSGGVKAKFLKLISVVNSMVESGESAFHSAAKDSPDEVARGVLEGLGVECGGGVSDVFARFAEGHSAAFAAKTPSVQPKSPPEQDLDSCEGESVSEMSTSPPPRTPLSTRTSASRGAASAAPVSTSQTPHHPSSLTNPSPADILHESVKTFLHATLISAITWRVNTALLGSPGGSPPEGIPLKIFSYTPAPPPSAAPPRSLGESTARFLLDASAEVAWGLWLRGRAEATQHAFATEGVPQPKQLETLLGGSGGGGGGGGPSSMSPQRRVSSNLFGSGAGAGGGGGGGGGGVTPPVDDPSVRTQRVLLAVPKAPKVGGGGGGGGGAPSPADASSPQRRFGGVSPGQGSRGQQQQGILHAFATSATTGGFFDSLRRVAKDTAGTSVKLASKSPGGGPAQPLGGGGGGASSAGRGASASQDGAGGAAGPSSPAAGAMVVSIAGRDATVTPGMCEAFSGAGGGSGTPASPSPSSPNASPLRGKSAPPPQAQTPPPNLIADAFASGVFATPEWAEIIPKELLHPGGQGGGGVGPNTPASATWGRLQGFLGGLACPEDDRAGLLWVVPRDGGLEGIPERFRSTRLAESGGFATIKPVSEFSGHALLLWAPPSAKAKQSPPNSRASPAGSPRPSRFPREDDSPSRGESGSPFGASSTFGKARKPMELGAPPAFAKGALPGEQSKQSNPADPPSVGPGGAMTPDAVKRIFQEAKVDPSLYLVGQKGSVFLKGGAMEKLGEALRGRRADLARLIQLQAACRSSARVVVGKRAVPIQRWWREVLKGINARKEWLRQHSAGLLEEREGGVAGIASEEMCERAALREAFVAPLAAMQKRMLVLLARNEIQARLYIYDEEVDGATLLFHNFAMQADELRRFQAGLFMVRERNRMGVATALSDHESGTRHRVAYDECQARARLLEYHKEATKYHRRAVRRREKAVQGLRREAELQLIMQAQAAPFSAAVHQPGWGASPSRRSQSPRQGGGGGGGVVAAAAVHWQQQEQRGVGPAAVGVPAGQAGVAATYTPYSLSRASVLSPPVAVHRSPYLY